MKLPPSRLLHCRVHGDRQRPETQPRCATIVVDCVQRKIVRKLHFMVKRDAVDDLVDLLYPLPVEPTPAVGPDRDPGDSEDLVDWEGYEAARVAVEYERQGFSDNLRAAEDAADEGYYGESDPVLNELRRAHQERLDSESRVRLLLAYAREFTPRAYKLEPLAQAGGLSVSGVRTAYTKVEIDEVSRRIGRPARPR
jgi:hypothetical protein